MDFPEAVSRLSEGLAGLESADEAPSGGRRGAVLFVIAPAVDGTDLEVLYTRRQPHLSSHPGQISFPGGRVEPSESVEAAALREAGEEVGLRADSVQVLGTLPAFYIPPSRFWMTAVAAAWPEPHPLTPHEGEVAEILHVPLSTLTDPDRWRAVPLSASGWTWAWQLRPRRLLWGATAVVTGVLLDLLVPGWSGGIGPEDLDRGRRVRPWEAPDAAGLATPNGPRRQALEGVADLEVPRPAGPPAPGQPPTASRMAAWADGVTDAVVRVRDREQQRGRATADGPIVVLVGSGTIGRVGRLTAERLAGRGHDVIELVAAEDMDPDALTRASVIVDALVGRGLRGMLADPLLDVVRALRHVGAPIVAVDLPSGIHPTDGLVGESVSADLTVTDPQLVPGHVASGAMPFVSDLYVVDGHAGLRRASVVDRPRDWGE